MIKKRGSSREKRADTLFKAFRDSPTPSPSTSSTLPTETKNSLAQHYPTASDPRRQKYELSNIIPTPSISTGKHRPAVQKVIEQEQAEALNEHGFLGGKIPQLLLASMLRKTNPTAVKCGHPANKYWNLLHFISMLWLGILAVYEEISYHGWKQVAQLIKDPTLKEHGAIHFVSLNQNIKFYHMLNPLNSLYSGTLSHSRFFYISVDRSINQ